MENELQVIGTKEVEERIIELRGQKILLDRDVAELYKTETRDINKAVRNNPEKFPSGYFFTLKPSEKQYVVENFHRMENLKKSCMLNINSKKLLINIIKTCSFVTINLLNKFNLP